MNEAWKLQLYIILLPDIPGNITIKSCILTSNGFSVKQIRNECLLNNVTNIHSQWCKSFTFYQYMLFHNLQLTRDGLHLRYIDESSSVSECNLAMQPYGIIYNYSISVEIYHQLNQHIAGQISYKVNDTPIVIMKNWLIL